jgi:hypothetical protein
MVVYKQFSKCFVHLTHFTNNKIMKKFHKIPNQTISQKCDLGGSGQLIFTYLILMMKRDKMK